MAWTRLVRICLRDFNFRHLLRRRRPRRKPRRRLRMQPDDDKRPALIRAWWHDLQNDPGARGGLRRCRTPIEAQALPVTIDLMMRLGWRPPEDDSYDWFGERIAAAAMVLAHVREDTGQPVAQSLGNSSG